MRLRKLFGCIAATFMCGMAYAAAPTLAHRWSFSGDYTDSVGGTSAIAIGDAVSFNESNSAVVMSGDGNGSGSLNLGVDMLPTDVPEVTIEIWVTQTAVKNWARLFDYGRDDQNYFTLTWCQGTDGNLDRAEVKKANAAVFSCDNMMAPYALETQYHIAVTFTANADGSTSVRWVRRNAQSGAVERAGAVVAANWTLADLESPNFYIGHSQYTPDLDANAVYDEVRVWKGALTDEQLTASALAGPDTLPDVGTPDPTLGTVRWTGAVDDDATNAGNWSPSAPNASTLAVFSGDFAAQIPSGSSFTCAGVVFENARLSADCDWRGLSAKIMGGTLDLAGRKFYLSQLDGEGVVTDGGIPSSYQPVEYIASSGAQWLSTGFTPACTDRIEMKLNFENKNGTQCLWCSRGTATTTSTFTAFMINGDKIRFDRNTNTAGGNVLSPTAGVTHTVVADGNTLACTLDGADAGTMAGKGGFTPGSPIVLFASHTAGANLTASTAMGNWASYRFYNLKVYDWKGGLKCDFVPVRRVEDGELGVYDRIGGTFAANMTDTPFTAGADVAGEADAEGGELHIDVASGASAVNEGVRVSGMVKVFKEGAGSYTAIGRMTNTGVGKFVSGTMDIAGGRFTVDGLGGAGTITSASGNLLKNGNFEEAPVSSGEFSRRTPAWWRTSGNIYLCKDNTEWGYYNRDGSVWCFALGTGYIYQNFTLDRDTVCVLKVSFANRGVSGGFYNSVCIIEVDGVQYFNQTFGTQVVQTRTFGNIALKAGTHTVKLGCGSNYSNVGMHFDNVSLTPAGVLDVNVPEGETSENMNVAITGGAGMQVCKTGKGELVMSRENSGFGAGGRRSGSVSMVVKEGVVRQTASEGTTSCGAQYGTIVVEDGAQFDMRGRVYHDYDYVIAGSGPDGAGALVNTMNVSSPWEVGGNNRAYLQDVTLSGDATIGGPESWALLFYNYVNEHTMYMNGHTLTIKGVTLYSESIAYSGAGTIVIDEDATVEFYHNAKSAPDCELVVKGVLQQHDQALSPVKALRFAAGGSFNNPWTTRPEFIVHETYAPNVQALSTSAVQHPAVTLGADGHTETTLDLSQFADVFDGSTTAFFGGSEVIVDLGARTFEVDTKLVSWENVPDATFTAAGAAAEAKEIALAVRADGLWAVRLFPDRPMTAKWTGEGDISNLLDPANWNCWNSSGTQLGGVAPGDYTTVIIADGTTTLSVPEGVTPPWGRVQFCDGEPKVTQWGRIFYGGDRYSNSTYPDTSYINIALGEYEQQGVGDIANLDGQNTGWQNSWLDWSQLRFDGWFKVAPAQAGSWHITQSFDDYFGFAVDGKWVVLNRTYTAKTEVDCEIAAGWHRFTIVCGDTWGGQGSRDVSVNGVKTPMAISINGGAAIAFSAANFELGTGQTVIKLGGDCDWRRLGRVALASGAVIDLNGHTLTTVGVVCDDYVGATVKNSAQTAGELRVEVPEGGTFALEGVAIAGDVKLVKTGGGTLVASTSSREFTGGTVVEAGVLKPGLIGPKFPLGTVNLLKNGNFDDGTAMYNNNGDWSYANGGNGFALPHWSGSNTGRYGLSKSSGTWVAKGRNGNIAKYALFLQTNGNTVDVSQDVEVKTPGKYCYYFIYAGRPNYTGATTELRLIHNGVSKTLATVTTTADTYSVCEGTVEIEAAGTYTLQFYQPSTSSDKANTIDNVVFACCDTGMTSGAVVVNEGATFEVNGKYDFWYNAFVLNGGTFQNASGADLGSGTAQMKYMALTADSTLNLQNSYGFIGNGYSRTYLDLGGNALTVNLNVSGKLFYLYNTEVRNGLVDVISGGWLETGNAGITAKDATIKCAAAVRANGVVEVGDYTAYRSTSIHNEGTQAFKVYGMFTPTTDIFYGCQMQNGSTINLAGRSGAWHTTMPVADSTEDNTKNSSRTVTFADDAEVTVNLYGRADLFALTRSANPFVVTWDEEPANLAGLKFVTDAKSKKMGLRLVPDTKMVPGEEGQVEKKGLRLVYLGGSVFLLR